MISQSIYSLIGGFPITPSDTTALSEVRALYVAGQGDVAVRMVADGSVLNFKGVPGGTLLPIQVDRVMATNTTATFILGLR
jgi:hypothetical protein